MDYQHHLPLPPGEGELWLTESYVPQTSCGHCHKRIPQGKALETPKDHYCGEDCANEAALNHLRFAGL